jgi:hypothetical protein
MDSWFFLPFPATLILVAGPEGDEERSGAKVLRLIQIRLATPSFDKNRVNCQHNSLEARIADSSSRTQAVFHRLA